MNSKQRRKESRKRSKNHKFQIGQEVRIKYDLREHFNTHKVNTVFIPYNRTELTDSVKELSDEYSYNVQLEII